MIVIMIVDIVQFESNHMMGWWFLWVGINGSGRVKWWRRGYIIVAVVVGVVVVDVKNGIGSVGKGKVVISDFPILL